MKKHRELSNSSNPYSYLDPPSFKISVSNLKSSKKTNSQTFFNLTSRLEPHFHEDFDSQHSHSKSKVRYKLLKPIKNSYIKTEPNFINSFIFPEKTKEGLAKYNLICSPPENLLDPSNTFVSFYDILNNDKEWTKNFDEPFSESNMVSQQLYHNIKQKSLFENQQKNKLKQSNGELFSTFSGFKKKETDIQKKVKIYVNEKDKDMKAILAVKKLIERNQEEEEDNEKTQSSKPKNKNNGIDSLDLLNLHYKFFWYKTNNTEWRPENREGATLTYINGKCYLFGGKASRIHNEIIELETKKWTMKELEMPKLSSIEPRLGHTAVVYKNKLLIYGGEHLYNEHLKIRDCLGGPKLIDFEKQFCKTLRTHGDFIENRRNHAYCLFAERFLFISGGINSNGRYLSDLMYLNLDTLKWSTCETENHLESLAFHTMILVYKKEPTNVVNLYKPFEPDLKIKSNSLNKIKEEGIYLFGGMNEKQTIFNTLRILKLGCYPLKWIEPETKGIPPQPRFLHSMNFYRDMNIIIIYGGRNDKLQEAVFSDICVLNVFNLCWSKVSSLGIGNVPKCSHSATIVGSKLVVFGGYTLNEYIGADIYLCELNQDMVKTYQNKQKYFLGDNDLNDIEENEPNFKPDQLIQANKKFNIFERNHFKYSTFLPIPIQGDKKQRKNSKLIKMNLNEESIKNF